MISMSSIFSLFIFFFFRYISVFIYLYLSFCIFLIIFLYHFHNNLLFYLVSHLCFFDNKFCYSSFIHNKKNAILFFFHLDYNYSLCLRIIFAHIPRVNSAISSFNRSNTNIIKICCFLH